MTPDSPLTRAKARGLPAARTSCETALAEEPDNADIRLCLGIRELQCGNPECALAQLDRAITIAPCDMRRRAMRGHVRHSLSRFADAAAVLHEALAFDPAMSGSDIGDDHKEYFSGEAALKAAGKDNTMNQF